MSSICSLYNEKPIGLVEKGGTLHGFDPGYRILVFWTQKKKPKYRRNHQKNREISVKNRYFGDFTEICPKNDQIDYRWRISCRPPPITEISAIFRRYFPKFCSLHNTMNPSTVGLLENLNESCHFHSRIGLKNWLISV